MKNKELFILAFKNSLRYKKRNIVTLLLMLVAEIIVILTVSISSSLNDYVNKYVINNVDGRSIYVSYDFSKNSESQIIQKLNKVNHIVAAVPQSSLFADGICSSLADRINGNNGYIQLHGGNPDTIPDVDYGRNLKEGETNVGIIPVNFYPDSHIAEGDDHITALSGKSYIGSKLTIGQGSSSYTFTVIGVYNSDECGQTMNTVYVPFHDIGAIGQTHQDNKENTTTVHSPVFAVVDQYSHLNSVLNELSQSGMTANLKVNMNTHLGIFINLIGFILFGITLLITFFSILFSTLNSIKSRTQEIGLMKSIGFTNFNVILLLNIEIVLIGLVSFVLSSILGSAAMKVLILYSGGSNSIALNISLLSFIITLLVSIIVPIVGTLSASLKSISIQPSYAMKE